MRAIILAAGASTRTYPLTATRPKPLLPLLDSTIISYTLDLLRDMGVIDEVIIVVNYLKDQIMDALGESHRGMKLTYVDQEEPLGTGHAVLKTEHLFDTDSSVLIMNGDDLFSREDVAKVLEKYPRIAVKDVTHPERYGIFEMKHTDGKRIATGLEEKPRYPKSSLANVGIYHLGMDIFNYLHKIKQSPRGELELTDAVKRYIDWNDIELISMKEFWVPIGFPWDLLTANEFLMRRNGPVKPIIDESATIKKGSEVRGTSIIGRDVKIGQGCLIENSIIMQGAQIASNSEVRDSIIGAYAYVDKEFITRSTSTTGIFSMVKGKKIKVERNALGCIIGDQSRLGKKITTLPGVKIWPACDVSNIREIDEDIHPEE
ncbi:MAG: sugar phosphate nucleotidyltransferase [Nanoarchaeota archaeon]